MKTPTDCNSLGDVRCALAFAGGFTTGTFLGILLEQKIALGSVMVRTQVESPGFATPTTTARPPRRMARRASSLG